MRKHNTILFDKWRNELGFKDKRQTFDLRLAATIVMNFGNDSAYYCVLTQFMPNFLKVPDITQVTRRKIVKRSQLLDLRVKKLQQVIASYHLITLNL